MNKSAYFLIFFTSLLLLLTPLLADLDDLSDGKWLRIGIDKEGVYSISANTLQSHGFSIPINQINTIKIFGQSGEAMSRSIPSDLSLIEQEIIVNTNSDGSLANIIFYASGPRGL